MSKITIDKEKLKNALTDLVRTLFMELSGPHLKGYYEGECASDIKEIMDAFVEEKEDESKNSP